MPDNLYADLDQLRSHLEMASANTQDDDKLVDWLSKASRAIDRYTRRKFYPRRETQFYNFSKSKELRLEDDLLQLDTFKTQNGACTIASGVMWLGTGDNWNRPPYDRIILKADAASVLNFSSTPQRANEVTGFWGYHEGWADAWIDTGTSLQIAYTASAGSINIAGGSTDTGSSDIQGFAPRISIGDFLRIDAEYFQVTGAGSANTIALVQGYRNGTSAVAHSSGTIIYKFSPETDVEYATVMLAAWQYAKTATPYQTRTGFVGAGELSVPMTWDPNIRDKLDRFKHMTFSVIS